MATGKELAQSVFNENRSVLLDDTPSFDSVKSSLLDALRILGEKNISSKGTLDSILANPRFLFVYPEFKENLEIIGLLAIDDDLRDLFRDENFFRVLKDQTASNELIRLIKAGSAATASSPTASLSGVDLAQAVFNENRSVLLDDTPSFDSVKSSLPEALRILGEKNISSKGTLDSILANPRFLLVYPEFKENLEIIGILTIDDDLRDLFRDENFFRVLKDQTASNELIRLIETDGVSGTAASVSTGTPTSPTGKALAKAMFDANKDLLLRTDTLDSIKDTLPGVLRIFAERNIHRPLIERMLAGPRYGVVTIGTDATQDFWAILSVDDPLRALFGSDAFIEILQDATAANELARLIEDAGASSGGSSAAETLFTANKDLLLRTDTLDSIKDTLPGVLRIFAERNIHRPLIERMLAGPRYGVVTIGTDATQDFWAILSVDDPLRALFGSDAFIEILQDATAANELARLIEDATPPPPEPVLTAPTLTIGRIGLDTVELSRTEVPTATGYQYRYQIGSNWGTWAPFIGTTIQVSGLTEGTAYRFQARALRGSTEGPVSRAVSAETQESPPPTPIVPPPTPLPDLTAPTVEPHQDRAGSDSFPVSWSAVDTATGYEYRIRTGFGTWEGWTSTGTDTEYTIPNLDANTLYFLIIRAVRDGTRGPSSSVVAFSTRSEPLSAPTLLSPTIGTTRVTLRWLVNISEQATGYEYEYAENPADFTSEWKSTGTNTEVEVTGLKESTLYRFRVRAVRNDDRSDPSNVVLAQTGSPTDSCNLIRPASRDRQSNALMESCRHSRII